MRSDKRNGKSKSALYPWTGLASNTSVSSFVEEIHSKLGIQARGKQIVETRDGYQVCEEISSYNPLFDSEKGVIEGKNCLFWDDNS
ncbi:MAG: hypothetical protein OMM_12566 [Candidatus Magnetoglobus multicellularis str. Araruama]|uniref:Uncharacterized protein n=1 Tax=Candidatus Magnetoglobus multicellularis str. Araruama TaxID=890399 RepID=A0A1V1NVI9_9BACT|nr:MAG: hypothetical protein OMM_12566 [Candidatus Magnetoglobus multicellularis str. Araruama]